MATHDYVIANQSGAAFRTDLNNALAAIVSNNSNSSQPATRYAYQWWADTSAGVMKIRNSANDGWIELFQLDGTITLEDGSASAPALANRGDLDTGVFFSAANTFNVATAGVERMELGAKTIFNEDGADVDFRIEGTSISTLFYVNAGDNRVGIGTSSPGSLLDVSASGASDEPTFKVSSENSTIFLRTAGSSGSFPTGGGGNDGELLYFGGDFRIGIGTASKNLIFFNGSSYAERMRIDSNGDVSIGTSSAGGNRLLVQLTDDNNDHFKVVGGSGQGRTNITVQMGNTDSNASTAFRISNSSGNTVASFFVMNNLDDLNITNQSNGGEILFNTSSTSNSLGSLTRARFDMDGNFFLGKGSTDVNNTGVELKQNGLSGFTRNGGGCLFVNRNTNNGTAMSLRRSGNQVGAINVTTTATTYASGTSDRSLKKNFESWTENTLNLFKNINPQKFNYTHEDDGAEKTKGYIAQDLVDSFPEAYPKDDDGKYMFNPSGMVVYLMKAIQELQAKVETLEAA